MTNHPRRSKYFQIDGHTGDWLFEGGVLRLRQTGDGWKIVGTTRIVDAGSVTTVSGPLPSERVVEVGNTPRAYHAIVGATYPTLGEAKQAIMIARQHYVPPTNDARLAEIRARVELKFPDASPEAKASIVEMEWSRSRYNRHPDWRRGTGWAEG